MRPMDRHRQAGLTLLELLLVVTILSAVAYMSLAVVDNGGNQTRFEDTRNRLALIRTAIIGDSSRSLNGQPEISGFVADMGRLPLNLNELVSEPVDCDPDTAGNQPCSWGIDAATGLWRGWNGPYLPASAGTGVFRDGWGNDDGGNNFGWLFDDAGSPGALIVQSYGLDGAAGGSDVYEVDYPTVGPLVAESDWRILVTDSGAAAQDDDDGNGITVDFGSAYAGRCSDSVYGSQSEDCIKYGSACRVTNYSTTARDSATECSAVSGTWTGQSHGWSCSNPVYTTQADCISGGGAWAWQLTEPGYVCNLPAKDNKADCVSSGVWVAPSFACKSGSGSDRSACEDAAPIGVWTPVRPGYFSGGNAAHLCMRIAYRRHGSIVEMTSSGTGGDHPVVWDGTPKLLRFTFEDDVTPFDSDSYLPIGQMAYRLYQYTTTCTTTPYPDSSADWRVFTVLPRTTPQPLTWSAS